jgi:hypothetical protein
MLKNVMWSLTVRGRMWRYGNYFDLAKGKEILTFTKLHTEVRVMKSTNMIGM